MKQLENLPSTKNPTRLICAGIIIYWITKIAYQFIDGWHLTPIEGTLEYWLLQAGGSLLAIGLILHWFSFKDILKLYRNQMIEAVKLLLANEAQFNRQTIEADEYFEDLKRKNKKALTEVGRLQAEVEFLKGQTKGYQRKSEQSDSFAKAMELLNSQLIESQKRLDKTIDSQDKTIKLLVKSTLEASKLSASAATIQRLDFPEITLYPEGNEHK